MRLSHILRKFGKLRPLANFKEFSGKKVHLFFLLSFVKSRFYANKPKTIFDSNFSLIQGLTRHRWDTSRKSHGQFREKSKASEPWGLLDAYFIPYLIETCLLYNPTQKHNCLKKCVFIWNLKSVLLLTHSI